MRCLVTGAAGFLGSHLVDRLLIDGHRVVGADNGSTGEWANLYHLEEHERFRLVHMDVRDRSAWAEMYKQGPVDRIYHLASPASPPQYQRDPVSTLETGLFGTAYALNFAANTGARFLYASTSEVYGDPENQHIPTPETFRGYVNSYGPRACYDEGKRAGEALCWAWLNGASKVDARVARIHNTYGPRMRPGDGRAVPNFISQALAGGAVTVYGSGRQTRSLCYVTDTIDGLVILMEHPENRGPVNIGNPQEISMAVLAGTIQRIVGKSVEQVFQALPEDDPRRRVPDILKAQTLLGWEPKVALEEGLRMTIEWMMGRV